MAVGRVLTRNVSSKLGVGTLFKGCFHVRTCAGSDLALLGRWNGVRDRITRLVRDCGFVLSLREVDGAVMVILGCSCYGSVVD